MRRVDLTTSFDRHYPKCAYPKVLLRQTPESTWKNQYDGLEVIRIYNLSSRCCVVRACSCSVLNTRPTSATMEYPGTGTAHDNNSHPSTGRT